MAIALSFLLRMLVALSIALLATPLAKALTNWLVLPFKWYTHAIDWLTNKAIDAVIHFTHWLAPEIEGNLDFTVKWFHHLGENSKYTHGAIKNTAGESASTFWWMAHTYIPKLTRAQGATTTTKTLIKVRTQPFTKAQVAQMEATIGTHVHKAIAADIPGIIAKPFPQINWDAKRWRKWLFPGAIAGGLAIPGSTTGGAVGGFTGAGGRVVARPGANTWERDYEKEQNKINSTVHTRLRKLNWLLAFASAGTLVLAGINKLGLSWLRCGNVNRLGRVLCKSPAHWIDDILGLITDFLVLTDICQVIPWMEEGLKVVEPLITDFTTGASAIVCRDSHARAAPLSVPALHLPASSLGIPTLQLP